MINDSTIELEDFAASPRNSSKDMSALPLARSETARVTIKEHEIDGKFVQLQLPPFQQP